MEEWLKVTQGSDSFGPVLCIPRVYICHLVTIIIMSAQAGWRVTVPKYLLCSTVDKISSSW